MEITREMWIGAGALAFVGAVVVMLPPTIPIAPVATSVRPHVRAVAAPPADAPIFSPAASVISAPALPPAREEPAREEEVAARDDMPPASHDWRDTARPAADDGDAPVQDPDFAMGYRWAEMNGVFERRDCRRWRGSPAEDGCRAYLRDTEDGEG